MQYDKADQQNCPRRVVFYGRVSTELEAQISALKNQMNWYLELAEHHPNWTVVGQYADEGISGTGMKTRPSFMKMLRDARKKKFDLIVTREVSRFARNTVDTLVTTRELKQYGVEVYFVNDDIWTMRGDGEVRLTIMASLAQDESRKMSERTKAGIQTSQKKGTYVAGPTPFGYKRDKKAHTLVVQESQAETVRKIFAWYSERAAEKGFCQNHPHERCGADPGGMALEAVSAFWKTQCAARQSGRGQDLLCHAPCRCLHQRKIAAQHGAYGTLQRDLPDRRGRSGRYGQAPPDRSWGRP